MILINLKKTLKSGSFIERHRNLKIQILSYTIHTEGIAKEIENQ